MSNWYARVLAAGWAAVLAATLTAAPALAATTWTIKPGGAITAMSGRFTVTDATTGSVITCSHSTASGTFKSGSGLSKSRVGSLSAVGFTRCTGANGPDFSVRAGLPWPVNLLSYSAAKGVAHGTLSPIQITMSGNGCNFVIDGPPGLPRDGREEFKYVNSTGRLTLQSTDNLTFQDVSAGCLGGWNDGDWATLGAIYTVTPKQAITSP